MKSETRSGCSGLARLSKQVILVSCAVLILSQSNPASGGAGSESKDLSALPTAKYLSALPTAAEQSAGAARLLLAQSETGASQAGPAAGDIYRLAPGDAIEIVVWGQPELSTTANVRPDGRVSTPLVKDLYVAGMTPTEAANALEGALSQYVRAPIVSVVVANATGNAVQQVRVVGEVGAPVSVPFRIDMTLIDVITLAGGLSPFADGNGAVILRPEGGDYRRIPVRLDDLVRNGDFTANVAMQPGDVVLIPEGFFAGDWIFNKSLSFIETFTDNVDLEPDDDKQSAFITTISPQAVISGQTGRFSGSLNAQSDIQWVSNGDNQGFDLLPRINGVSTTELSRGLLFLDANGSLTRQLLNTRDSNASSSQSTVYNATLSPYLTNRIDNVADSTFRLSASTVGTFDEGGSGDDLSQGYIFGGNWNLDSGNRFNRLQWNYGAGGSFSLREDDSNVRRADTGLNLTYAVDRSYSLLGGAGYQFFDDGDSGNDVNGITWNVGFQWTPDQDTLVRLTYGRVDDDESFRGELQYRLGAWTTVGATYSERLQTGQERLLNSQNFIVVDPNTGILIDSRTGLPFNPNASSTTLSDATTRTKTFDGFVSYTRNRDSIQVNGRVEFQDEQGGNADDQDTYLVDGTWTRALLPGTSATLQASYQHSEFSFDKREDDDVTAGLSLSHRLNARTSVGGGYIFNYRDSSDSDSEYKENLVSVNLTIAF